MCILCVGFLILTVKNGDDTLLYLHSVISVGDSWSGLDGIACRYAVEQHALALLAHESVILGITVTCCDQ